MSSIREALKSVTPSGIRPPGTKVTKADFPVETVQEFKENNPNLINQNDDLKSASLKRKKTEADLRESLRQRKLNTTTTLTTSTAAKKTKTDLNKTVEKRNALSTTITSKPTLTRTKSASSLNKTLVVTSDTAKKRPAWDIKGRLEDMEKLTELLKSEVKRNQDNVSGLTTQLVDRENQITTIKETKSSLEMHVDGSKKELEAAFQSKLELQNKIVELQQQHNNQMQDLLYKHRSLETIHQTTVSSLNMSKAENDSLRLTVDTQRGQISAMQCEIDSLKSALAAAENLCKDRKKRIEDLEIQIDEKNRTIEGLESEVRQADDLRKKLHNTIQELKGNIRVFCRVRPLLGAELSEFMNAPPTFEYPTNNDRTIDISTTSLSGITGAKSDKKFSFTYDKVFQSNSTQDSVFSEISQLVQSALDGYNTCIFAYGQTGSGKTYTMEGPGIDTEIDMPIVDTEKRGMIPRAVEQIFQTAESLKDKGWTYEMEVNYLEIYNETIRDLLCPQNNIKEEIKYEIKHDNKGNTSVTNMTTMKVRNPSQVYDLLRRASKNRAVSKTNMNEHSSRSHSVFQLKLTGTNSITSDQVKGLLNLIDLAGSERLDKSGVTGQHLKETQNINKSLSSLGDVIAALGNKEAHIPYRNSKLTYLLQNSLGGNSKTLMFVNISPRPTDLNESISSLRFATKVNSCEIGTAKKQAKMDMKAL